MGHRADRASEPHEPDRVLERVAVFSLHTSPIDQPGTGDSGGMNVYIPRSRTSGGARRRRRPVHAVPWRCRPRDQAPDQTRARGLDQSRTMRADPQEGAPAVPAGVPRRRDPAREDERPPYDLVHSHYWLSGWVGNALRELWDVPLVSSFHTLGKVKNYSLAGGRAAGAGGTDRRRSPRDRRVEPDPRGDARRGQPARRVVPRRARAHPLVPPGVDTGCSRRDREAARGRLYLSGLRLALFVGRLQALKGPDVASGPGRRPIARWSPRPCRRQLASSVVRREDESGRSRG